MRQRLRLETKVDHLAPGEVEFRPLAASDFPTLTAWLLQPHVRRFYQKKPITLEEVALEYGPPVRGEEPTICHLALSSGVPFAYLQCYRNADYPEWVAIIEPEDGISVDLFIGDAGYVGRGFGRAALGGYLRQVAFPHYTFETRAYIGHELTNKAALRCSLAVGFLPLRPFVEDGAELMLLAIERSALTGS